MRGKLPLPLRPPPRAQWRREGDWRDYVPHAGEIAFRTKKYLTRTQRISPAQKISPARKKHPPRNRTGAKFRVFSCRADTPFLRLLCRLTVLRINCFGGFTYGGRGLSTSLIVRTHCPWRFPIFSAPFFKAESSPPLSYHGTPVCPPSTFSCVLGELLSSYRRTPRYEIFWELASSFTPLPCERELSRPPFSLLPL